jgi:pyruvate dehydrogenase E1 component
VSWEPAFGQDFEWAFCRALSQLGRPDGSAAYFRLSTRPVDQALAGVPRTRPAGRPAAPTSCAAAMSCERDRTRPARRDRRRGRRARPEALEAAEEVDARVVCLTSPDLVFRALQARRGLRDGDDAILDTLFPRRTARDAARRPPAHARLPRRIHGVPITSLGVTEFGSRATSASSTPSTASTPRRSSVRCSTSSGKRHGVPSDAPAALRTLVERFDHEVFDVAGRSVRIRLEQPTA